MNSERLLKLAGIDRERNKLFYKQFVDNLQSVAKEFSQFDLESDYDQIILQNNQERKDLMNILDRFAKLRGALFSQIQSTR